MLKEPYLDHAGLMNLIRRYKRAKNSEIKSRLREEIFNNNVRFIRKQVLKKVNSNSDSIEDVFNSAVVSFFEGLEKFKPNKGFKFQTYISFWINKAIYEQFSGDNIVKIPRNDFFLKDSAAVSRAKNAALHYLDKPIVYENGGERDPFDAIAGMVAFDNSEHLDNISDGMKLVNIAMNKALNHYERTLVTWRYLCEPPLTLDEVSLLAGLSIERTRQVIAIALYKVKMYIQTKGKSFGRFSNGEGGRASKIPKYTHDEIMEIHDMVVKARK
jgi:RNA polymerase sigma factor (sigma-70 family)